MTHDSRVLCRSAKGTAPSNLPVLSTGIANRIMQASAFSVCVSVFLKSLEYKVIHPTLQRRMAHDKHRRPDFGACTDGSSPETLNLRLKLCVTVACGISRATVAKH